MYTNRGELLRRRIEADLERLQAIENRPQEPEFAEGDDIPRVVWFRRNFQTGSLIYTYAAVKAAGYWYVSGRAESMQRRTWDQLMDWLYSSFDSGHTDYEPEVWYASEWELV